MMVFWGYVAFACALGAACLIAVATYRDWMKDHRTTYRLVWINRTYKEARCKH